jgi:hypothetical protein
MVFTLGILYDGAVASLFHRGVHEKRGPGMSGKDGIETRSARRTLRHTIDIDVEVTDSLSGIQIKARAKDLSLYGCGVNTKTPLPSGTKVLVKMVYEGKQVAAFGQVMYGRPDIGMGIAFTGLAPNDRKLLDDWFSGQPHSQEEDKP